MMEFVRWLIFIKIVSQVVEIRKDRDKKDCNKKMVIIKKDHDN